MPNTELAYKILDEIDANPRSWDQSTWFGHRWWRCGTTACFAGHACLLSGDKPDWDARIDGTTGWVITEGQVHRPVMSRAMDLLDISWAQADRLFSSRLDRERLGWYVEEIFGPDPTPTRKETNHE